ncbi:hypothetical protein [Companilactobacillus keshanensis]|uniref:Uncharacterized protein n=1 Tax=Companilactobacillus keshanensis TaxID=2486003 RepID=A0ABW4BU90_9LACO|nr:hypothetical protein [Companilactobacillus keshanensis]
MSEIKIDNSTTLEDAKELILKPELEKIILNVDIAADYLPILYHVFRLNRITILGNKKAVSIAPNIILNDNVNGYDERAIFVEVK